MSGAVSSPGVGEADRLVDRFLARHGPGTVSVWCGDLSSAHAAGGRPTYAREAGVPHYAASTMKLPLLVAAHRGHQRGALDLDRPVRVHNRFASALDGSAFALARADDQDDETWDRLGDLVPLRDLARHAIVCSGNLATNLLLDVVGAPAVAEVLRDAGCSAATVVSRGIGDAAARKAGLDNEVTAQDLCRLLAGLAAGHLAHARTSAEVERVLAGQRHREKIPAGLPPGTYVANKTGWVDGVAHDAALVRPRGGAPYALAVCTTVAVPEPVATDLIRELSTLLWKARTS